MALMQRCHSSINWRIACSRIAPSSFFLTVDRSVSSYSASAFPVFWRRNEHINRNWINRVWACLNWFSVSLKCQTANENHSLAVWSCTARHSQQHFVFYLFVSKIELTPHYDFMVDNSSISSSADAPQFLNSISRQSQWFAFYCQRLYVPVGHIVRVLCVCVCVCSDFTTVICFSVNFFLLPKRRQLKSRIILVEKLKSIGSQHLCRFSLYDFTTDYGHCSVHALVQHRFD